MSHNSKHHSNIQLKLRTMIKNHKVTFMDLPLEVRTMVYEAYIEHQREEPGHQYCNALTASDFDDKRPCSCQTGSKRFWIPFGFYAEHHGKRTLFHTPHPALWHVSKTIGEEAMQVYFTTRLCFDLHRDRHNNLGPALRAWPMYWSAHLVSMIRTIHFNFAFYIWEGFRRDAITGYVLEPVFSDDLVTNTYSNPDFPLFRVETRNRGKELRLLVLDSLLEEQREKLVRKLQAVGVPRGAQFDGGDLLALAGELMHPPEVYTHSAQLGWYFLLKAVDNHWILQEASNTTKMLLSSAGLRYGMRGNRKLHDHCLSKGMLEEAKRYGGFEFPKYKLVKEFFIS